MSSVINAEGTVVIEAWTDTGTDQIIDPQSLTGKHKSVFLFY